MGVPDPRGSTFAERTAAGRGDKDFKQPETKPVAPSTFASRAGGKSPVVKPSENDTFASRAKGQASVKQVDSDEETVEDKAVASKRTTKKS